MSITYVWFSFRGRINRKAYWLLYFLPVFLLNILSGVLDGVIGTMQMTEYGAYGLISLIVGIASLWPMLAAGTKRLHDRDKSGWWQLLYFVPFAGALFLFIYLGFLKGSDGANRFGPDPLEGSADWSAQTAAAE